jgi:hypothetical protein
MRENWPFVWDSWDKVLGWHSRQTKQDKNTC